MEPVTKHLLGSNASHVPSCAAVVVEDIDKQLESELNKKLAYFEASNFQSADTGHAAYFGLDQPVRNLIDEIQARKVFEDAFPVLVEEETRNKKEIREQKENMVAASAVIPPPPGSQWQDMPKVAVNGALIANPAEMTAEKHRQFRHTWTMQERQRFKAQFTRRGKRFDKLKEVVMGKSIGDCIWYYYLTKHSEHYKQAHRRYRQAIARK